MKCDICGEEGVRIRNVTRTYGKGKDLFMIDNIPVVSCPIAEKVTCRRKHCMS